MPIPSYQMIMTPMLDLLTSAAMKSVYSSRRKLRKLER